MMHVRYGTQPAPGADANEDHVLHAGRCYPRSRLVRRIRPRLRPRPRLARRPAHDATQDVVTVYDQPGELTGTGEVVDGKVHVHVVCGIEGDVAKAGHLHAATVETFFVGAYVNVVDG